MLNKLNNQIIVQGHTDDLPINTVQFPSNWELSTRRATNVVRFLIDECPESIPEDLLLPEMPSSNL